MLELARLLACRWPVAGGHLSGRGRFLPSARGQGPLARTQKRRVRHMHTFCCHGEFARLSRSSEAGSGSRLARESIASSLGHVLVRARCEDGG
eukprot:4850636-Pleurochrysis_carterae.AAC.2